VQSSRKYECEKRDTARLFMVAGQREVALRILCSTRVVTGAYGIYRISFLLVGGYSGMLVPAESRASVGQLDQSCSILLAFGRSL
jgi:hypothetical protein